MENHAHVSDFRADVSESSMCIVEVSGPAPSVVMLMSLSNNDVLLPVHCPQPRIITFVPYQAPKVSFLFFV